MSQLQIELALTMSLKQEQRQQFLNSMSQVQDWRRDPLQFMREHHPAFSQMIAQNKKRTSDFGKIWKDIRDQQILTPDLDPVIINIFGPNGAGKGVLGQGFMRFIVNDQYLQLKAQQSGYWVVPIVETFSTTIKSAQIPKSEGGPGVIPKDVDHGTFLNHHYEKADEYASDLGSKILARSGDDVNFGNKAKIVFIRERPTPTAYPVERTLRPQVKGVNRALGSLYSDAFNPIHRKKTNYFLLKRDYQVGELAVDDRNKLASINQSVENPFTGHTRYWLTSAHGVTTDVALLAPQIQIEAADLIGKSVAPARAKQRSDQEMAAIQDELFQAGEISEPTTSAYFEFLKRVLTYSPKDRTGVASSRFHIVENLAISGRPEYHLDYLTHFNVAVSMYQQQMMGDQLRGYVFGK